MLKLSSISKGKKGAALRRHSPSPRSLKCWWWTCYKDNEPQAHSRLSFPRSSESLVQGRRGCLPGEPVFSLLVLTTLALLSLPA